MMKIGANNDKLFFSSTFFFMNLANTKKVGMYGKLFFVGYVQQKK